MFRTQIGNTVNNFTKTIAKAKPKAGRPVGAKDTAKRQLGSNPKPPSVLLNKPRRPLKPPKIPLAGERVANRSMAACNFTKEDVAIWSDEKRVEAVSAYVAMGSMVAVSQATGISTNTLWSWKKHTVWWTDLERTIRGEQNSEYSAVISDIVTSSLLAIQDRIKSGDFIYNPRSGETARVPLKAKDLNSVVNTLLSKRSELVRENRADSVGVTDEKTLENKLTQLADAFKSFVASKKIETIDITPVLSDTIPT